MSAIELSNPNLDVAKVAENRSDIISPLHDLVDAGKLSKDGADWITVATDPFHDLAARLEGYPDIQSCKTVVFPYTKSVTVSRPSYIPSTDNWDCMIALTPFSENSLIATNGSLAANGLLASATDVNYQPTFNHLVVQTNIAGTTMWGAEGPSRFSSLGPDSRAKGGYRIIAAAFEVHNATADLYKQGTVTCYRAPSGMTDGAVALAAGGTDKMLGPVKYFRKPPRSLDEAMLMSRTVQWEAKDGCYVVQPLRRIDNPIGQYVYGGSIFLESEPDGTNAIPCYTTILNSGQPPIALDRYNSMDYACAYFTGLSPQTMLTITYRCVIELCPTATDPFILTATESSTYDPLALELYEQAMKEVPIGCPVAMNGLGDWWESVKDAVSPLANTLLDVVGGSGIPVLSQGANVAKGLFFNEHKGKAKLTGTAKKLVDRQVKAEEQRLKNKANKKKAKKTNSGKAHKKN